MKAPTIAVKPLHKKRHPLLPAEAEGNYVLLLRCKDGVIAESTVIKVHKTDWGTDSYGFTHYAVLRNFEP